jgi:YD repeat-containing protein
MKHVHQFVYDTRGRLIQKKAPGQAAAYYVYDNRNRLVLTQDGNLRTQNKWAFVKYDVKGRKIISGLYTNTTQTDLTSIQNLVNAQYTSGSIWNEQRAANTTHGYTNLTFPITNTNVNNTPLEIYNVVYFDDYDFDNNGSADYKYDSTQAAGTTSFWKPYGFATGSKKLVI